MWRDPRSPSCDGFVVGLCRQLQAATPRPIDEDIWRELTGTRDQVPLRVTALQIGCDCGWRSPRFAAPEGAKWKPYVVMEGRTLLSPDFGLVIPEWVEERAKTLWAIHVDDTVRATVATERLYYSDVLVRP